MSVPRHRTRLYGLGIASDLPICRVGDEGGAFGPPDLTVLRGPELAEQRAIRGRTILDLTLDGVPYHRATILEDGSCQVRFWGLCDFTLDASLRRAVVNLLPGADPGLVAILIEGAIPALVLVLRGEGVLHASAVHMDERRVAFVGRSGMGKSTLAALVCGQGGRLMTDDVLRYEVEGKRVFGYAGTTELRLRPASAGLAEGYEHSRRRRTSDGRTALSPGWAAVERAPLDAVVLPRLLPDAEAVSLRALSGAEALLALLRFPRFPGMVDVDVHRTQLAKLTELASLVPVAVLDVPWGQPPSPSLAAAVVAAIGDLDPSEAGRL